MITRYHQFSNQELLGFKHLVSGDPNMIEELWNRLELAIKNEETNGLIGEKVRAVGNILYQTDVEKYQPDLHKVFEELESLV